MKLKDCCRNKKSRRPDIDSEGVWVPKLLTSDSLLTSTYDKSFIGDVKHATTSVNIHVNCVSQKENRWLVMDSMSRAFLTSRHEFFYMADKRLRNTIYHRWLKYIHPSYSPSNAAWSLAITILFIPSIACMTLLPLTGSASFKRVGKIVGATCHERPYLSLSQPQRPGSPPSLQSFSHNSSISSCVSAAIKKRNCFGKFELRSAIECNELHPVQLKGHGHYRSRWLGSALAVVGNSVDFGVLKNGDVEICCFFCLIVKPEEWLDLLHDVRRRQVFVEWKEEKKGNGCQRKIGGEPIVAGVYCCRNQWVGAEVDPLPT